MAGDGGAVSQYPELYSVARKVGGVPAEKGDLQLLGRGI